MDQPTSNEPREQVSGADGVDERWLTELWNTIDILLEESVDIQGVDPDDPQFRTRLVCAAVGEALARHFDRRAAREWLAFAWHVVAKGHEERAASVGAGDRQMSATARELFADSAASARAERDQLLIPLGGPEPDLEHWVGRMYRRLTLAGLAA